MIALYEQACKVYATERFSSNHLEGEITDQELITIYLFCLIYEEKQKKNNVDFYFKVLA